MSAGAKISDIGPARAIGLAAALVTIITGLKVLAGWNDLSALRLPDTDDVLRLVQVRDWLAGQSFHDLTQHRLGTGDGIAMHWSRLADLGPAAIIVATRGWLGASGADVLAVAIWPACLFFVFLLIAGEMAARVSGTDARIIGVVLAALAWPATGLFVPGRIDHHGLQIVLLLSATLAALGAPTHRTGTVIGLLVMASLSVGMETAPMMALLCAACVTDWCWRGGDARDRLIGLAVGLGVGLLGAVLIAPAQWSYPACDGFTRSVATAAAGATMAVATLCLLPNQVSRRARIAAGVVAAAGVLAVLSVAAPTCLADPYATIDPFVRARWLSRVEEARGLFALGPGEAVGFAALPIVACVVAGRAAVRGDRGMRLVFVLIAASVALSLIQVRAIYAAAALAPAVMAPLILHARRARPMLAPFAWAASAGVLYPVAAQAAVQRPQMPAARCNPDPAIARLAALPPGRVLAPIDLGPRLLLETPHHVIAAPYHRDAAGIALSLRASTPHAARAAGADYWLSCPRKGRSWN